MGSSRRACHRTSGRSSLSMAAACESSIIASTEATWECSCQKAFITARSCANIAGARSASAVRRRGWPAAPCQSSGFACCVPGLWAAWESLAAREICPALVRQTFWLAQPRFFWLSMGNSSSSYMSNIASLPALPSAPETVGALSRGL